MLDLGWRGLRKERGAGFNDFDDLRRRERSWKGRKKDRRRFVDALLFFLLGFNLVVSQSLSTAFVPAIDFPIEKSFLRLRNSIYLSSSFTTQASKGQKG